MAGAASEAEALGESVGAAAEAQAKALEALGAEVEAGAASFSGAVGAGATELGETVEALDRELCELERPHGDEEVDEADELACELTRDPGEEIEVGGEPENGGIEVEADGAAPGAGGALSPRSLGELNAGLESPLGSPLSKLPRPGFSAASARPPAPGDENKAAPGAGATAGADKAHRSSRRASSIPALHGVR